MHAMMVEMYAIGPRPPIRRIEDLPLVSLEHGLRGGLILHHAPQHPVLHPLGWYSIPLVPVWPGFAANTLCFAGVIATLWATPWIIRRGLRRRGRCHGCGYDARDLPACPECGRPSNEERPRVRALQRIADETNGPRADSSRMPRMRPLRPARFTPARPYESE
ncbi:MAG: hypothetical protein AAFX79_03945 [Planctomycetota bacterium]